MWLLDTIETYTPPKDWTARPDGSYVRDLVGGESFMAWMHEHRSGGVSFVPRLHLHLCCFLSYVKYKVVILMYLVDDRDGSPEA